MKNRTIFPVPYLWPVGEGGFVQPERVVAAGTWRSKKIRREAQQAKEQNRLIDLTFGKSCKWMLVLDSGHYVLISCPVPVGMVTHDERDYEEESPPWE